jgi:hypothetical protein
MEANVREGSAIRPIVQHGAEEGALPAASSGVFVHSPTPHFGRG